MGDRLRVRRQWVEWCCRSAGARLRTLRRAGAPTNHDAEWRGWALRVREVLQRLAREAAARRTQAATYGEDHPLTRKVRRRMIGGDCPSVATRDGSHTHVENNIRSETLQEPLHAIQHFVTCGPIGSRALGVR